ncbi:MAG: VCBS repeat-containing protein [Bacteroidetes bacterium]|nr:VCBS repeat-containing protein [Bacteroidota bacterium]
MKKRFILPILISFILFLSLTPVKSQVTFNKLPVDLNFNGACSVNAADIDSDGYVDILSTGWDGNIVSWWKNDGNYPPDFTQMTIDGAFPGASYLYPDDIDGDSDIDIAASAWEANRITVWWNNGDSPVTWTKQGVDSSFQHAHEVKFGDIDGIGGLDIVAASALDNEVSWWQNNGGTPVQWTKYVISNSVIGARSVFPVDIEGDGDTDILSAGLNDHDVSVFVNDGENPIGWTEEIIDGSFIGAHWVFSKDMDNDTDMDVLAAGYMGGDIAIWYNDGNNPPQWTKFVLDANFPGALSVVAANLNEDEFPDVVAGGDIAADVRIYYNDGTGAANFSQVILDPAFYGVWPVFACDLDNDTDVDILAASSTLDDIYWWDNQTSATGIHSPSEDHGCDLKKISPNPFHEKTTVHVSLQKKSQMRVELYSLYGATICTLFNGMKPKGDHWFTWNGTDNLGAKVPDGIYICHIVSDRSVISSRILKIR